MCIATARRTEAVITAKAEIDYQRAGNILPGARAVGLAPAAQAVTLHARLGGVSVEVAPKVCVREVNGDHAGYLEILFAGYGVDSGAEDLRRMLALEHQTPGLRRYLAEVNGTPAAAAALFGSAGTSLLAGVATLPRFRNRGCQTALIGQRLLDAAADSDLAVATTAIASASRDNLQRQGFQVTHVRTIWH